MPDETTLVRGARIVGAIAAGAARVPWAVVPELLLTLALVTGWSLLTWGLATLLTWQVWPISAGLFLLGCCGWRLLARLFGHGLYALSRSREDR